MSDTLRALHCSNAGLRLSAADLLQIIGQICAFDRGVPLFDTLVRGEPLNSGQRSLAQETRNFALSYGIHIFTDNHLVLSQYSRYTGEYRLEVAVFEGGGSFWPNISGRRGRPPPTICARIDRPVNALQLCRWKFSHKETLQHTFFEKAHFYTENGNKIRFSGPLWGLGATYDVHLRLIG